AFIGHAAWTDTVTLATPLLFTGLAAAVAFRMQLFNIGAEGQLYLGAICAAGAAIWLGPHHATALTILAMCACGAAGASLWALIPGALKAFARTNEIITSLMLNYVAGLLLTYLIFDSASPWRDISTIQTRSFPQAVALQPSQFWPTVSPFSVVVPLGFLLAIGIAAVLAFLFRATRFGFEMNVIGDSQRAARYAGMRTRRKILAVMAISGGIAGLGGASQVGDFTHELDASPQGLQGANYGYTGIVVAALGRYNPFAVCLVAVLLGGLQNAGLFLQGVDFPSGLVGAVMGFWAVQRAPGPTALVLVLAVLTAAFAGAVMALIHAFLVVTLRASQIVSGLALTIFAGGLGLSSYLGNDLGLADVPPL